MFSLPEQWWPMATQLMMYILMLSTFFSFSYSLMEIGHLSIIPAVAKDQSEAVELNAWRFVFHVFKVVI